MTLPLFQESDIEDGSTSSPLDSPASRTLSLAVERELTMTVTSGQKLAMLLPPSDHGSQFLRTLLDFSLWWNPIVSLRWKARRFSFFRKTWTRQEQQSPSESSEESLDELSPTLEKSDIHFPDIPMADQSFYVFQLAPLARGTDEIAFGLSLTKEGLLPTPAVMDSGLSTDLGKIKKRRKKAKATKKNANGFGVSLGESIRLLPTIRSCSGLRSSGANRTEIMDRVNDMAPTPRASDGSKNVRTKKGAEKELARGKSPDLTTAMQMMAPTPNARDYKSPKRVDSETPYSMLNETIHNLDRLVSTPNAQDAREVPAELRPSRTASGRKTDYLSREIAIAGKLLKTPSASDGEGGVMDIRDGADGHYKLRNQIPHYTKTLAPSPTSRDYKGKNSDKHLSKKRGHHDQLPNRIAIAESQTGQNTGLSLQVGFALWMQGYPENFLDNVPVGEKRASKP